MLQRPAAAPPIVHGQVRSKPITHYGSLFGAIATRADYSEAHFNLARLLLEKGEANEALDHYRRAIEIRPNDADTHNNYGSALRELGQIDNAKREYEIALTLQPNYVEARLNLATLFLQGGKTSEAIAQLEEAKRIQPNDPIVRTDLGNALMKSGRAREAVAEFNQSLAILPNGVGAMDSLAWLLATAPDTAVRDGARAVEVAERANEITMHADPVILHTLAAAYAEAGQFEDALVTARRGMKLANQSGKTAIYDALRDELPLYELGLPYHQATVHQR